MKSNFVETIVGALVIAVAAGFIFFVYNSSEISKGGGGYQFSAEFENVEGISVGSDIRMAGIKVGSVVGQKLDQKTYQAVLTLSVAQFVKLPDDTTAKITTEGLFGAKYIALELGGSDDLIKDGGALTHTQSALDIWSLVSEYMFSDKKNK